MVRSALLVALALSAAASTSAFVTTAPRSRMVAARLRKPAAAGRSAAAAGVRMEATAGANITPGTGTSAPLKLAYAASALATTGVYAASAYASLAKVAAKKGLFVKVALAWPLAMPARHYALCIASALCPLPLIWAAFAAVAAGGGGPSAGGVRDGLEVRTFRRINLGLAASAVWSAMMLWKAPTATVGVVKYGKAFGHAAFGVYLVVAATCMAAWVSSLKWATSDKQLLIEPKGASSMELVGSLAKNEEMQWVLPMRLFSNPSRMKNTILTAGFAFFTVLPMYTSFPLATVPSMLGKNFGRAYAAWTLLGTAACWSLTDAAREGKKRMSDPMSKALGSGVVAWSALHLACTGLKVVLEWGELARWYPATFAQPLWSLASLVLFAGVLIPVPSLGSITGVAWR